MGLVYFGAVTLALLALNRLIGYKGSGGSRPSQPRVTTVAHAT